MSAETGGGAPPKAGKRGFAKALADRFRIVGALAMREIHVRYGRRNIGFLWIMAEPFLFTAGVIALRSLLPFEGVHRGMSLAGFVMTGYTPFLLYRHMVGHAIHCIVHNDNVLYHRRIKFLDLFLSSFLLEAAGIAMAFAFGCWVFYAAGFMGAPEDLLLLLVGWFFAIWFSAALALLVGALSPLSTLVERLYNPLSYLSLPISGAFFMVMWIPSEYREAALLIPTVHYFEAIRAGYFGVWVDARYDLVYLGVICLALTLAALFALVQARKWVAIR